MCGGVSHTWTHTHTNTHTHMHCHVYMCLNKHVPHADRLVYPCTYMGVLVGVCVRVCCVCVCVCQSVSQSIYMCFFHPVNLALGMFQGLPKGPLSQGSLSSCCLCTCTWPIRVSTLSTAIGAFVVQK